MNNKRPTVMEVDVNAFCYNVEKIQEFVGNNVQIMPVLKANAYGTNINYLSKITNKFSIIAVAIVEEGVKLRKYYGYKGEIFILNPPLVDELDEILENNLTIGICDEKTIEKIGNTNKKVTVHLEIDTGMGRTGIFSEDIIKYIKKIKEYSNINLEGIYTHFSSADNDLDYTNYQIRNFKKCVEEAKKLVNLKYIHCSASNGILNFPECNYNLVRPGIILYGYESCDKTFSKIKLKPVCKLKSKITYLKYVEEGYSIGYSRKFITNKKSKIATIPIGYADGFPRMCNKGYIVIDGKKAPIIGSVCMDNLMVDVTNIDNTYIGQDVYIWDNDLIKIEDIAELTNTINYEIISRISERVPRVFFNFE